MFRASTAYYVETKVHKLVTEREAGGDSDASHRVAITAALWAHVMGVGDDAL